MNEWTDRVRFRLVIFDEMRSTVRESLKQIRFYFLPIALKRKAEERKLHAAAGCAISGESCIVADKFITFSSSSSMFCFTIICVASRTILRSRSVTKNVDLCGLEKRNTGRCHRRRQSGAPTVELCLCVRRISSPQHYLHI